MASSLVKGQDQFQKSVSHMSENGWIFDLQISFGTIVTGEKDKGIVQLSSLLQKVDHSTNVGVHDLDHGGINLWSVRVS